MLQPAYNEYVVSISLFTKRLHGFIVGINQHNSRFLSQIVFGDLVG